MNQRLSSPCVVLLSGILMLATSACSTTDSQRDKPTSISTAATKNEKTDDARKLNIYENEAVPKGAQAVLSGTVENTTDVPLSKLSVQLELKKRNADEREMQMVKVIPEQIPPGTRGTYSLKIPSREWGSSRIIGVSSETQAVNLSFIILPGAKRPVESAPAGKTIVIDRPATPRSGNDGFINTPDTPYAVP